MNAATARQGDGQGRRGTLAAALRDVLAEQGLAVDPQPLADTGLAHDHLRLPGTGLIARIPKQSQMQLGATENLRYQAACYERAAASGHAPHLHSTLPPSAALPRGGLLVEEIRGRPARLPDDLPAIATALAAIHSLKVPLAAARAPLLASSRPLRDLLDEIGAQARYLPAARIAPATAAIIDNNLGRLRECAGSGESPPVRLISFDAHPGNFLVDGQGRAVLVDLEKCRYSAPPLDLAHATLYTSTTWDVASHAVLSVDQVAETCRTWLSALAPGLADAQRGWIVPLRRAMWLWSMTWCAKWRVLSGDRPEAGADGEDWSSGKSDEALIAHVRGRVDHYLDPETAAMVAAEFDQLAPRL